jgi:hypothetical protein
MPVAIDATAGGASANSFVTLAEATTYMQGRMNSDAFDNATTDEQNRSLVEATRDVSVMEYVGRRASSTQVLSWPRWGATDPDSAYGWLFVSTVVPQRIKDATCELAFQYLSAGSSDLASADPNAGVIEKTVDVLTTRWQPFQRPTGLSRFPRVLNLIRPLLAAGTGDSPELIRG